MKVKTTEYENEYKPELERRVKERLEERKTEGLEKLMKDMNVENQPPHGMSNYICVDENRYIWK